MAHESLLDITEYKPWDGLLSYSEHGEKSLNYEQNDLPTVGVAGEYQKSGNQKGNDERKTIEWGSWWWIKWLENLLHKAGFTLS